MFRPSRSSPARAEAVERLARWTRGRFGLAPDAPVSVAEIACALPGCPPLETVVLFWIGEQCHRFKAFKPVELVAEGDVPYAWLRDSLALTGDAGVECC